MLLAIMKKIRLFNYGYRPIFNIIKLSKVYFSNYNNSAMNKQFKTSDFTDEAFKISAVDEPEEYRTIYLENLPLDWDENEIQLRLEQIGTVEKLHLIKNTLGDSLGKGI